MTVQGRLADGGGLAAVRQEKLEGLGVHQLRALLLQGLGLQLDVQASLLAANGADRAPGRHELGVELPVLRRACRALAELLLQGLGADPGRRHIVGGNVGLQLVPVHEIFLELVAQGAAVSRHGSVVDLLVLVLHELRKGLAFAPFFVGGFELFRLDGLLQAVPFAALGLYGLPGGHDLRSQGQLPLVGAVEIADPLVFLLQGLDVVIGGGHAALGHVLRNVVQIPDVLAELIAQGAAVALEHGFSRFFLVLLQIVLEGLAGIPGLSRLFQGGVIDARLQTFLVAPLGAHGFAGRHQFAEEFALPSGLRGIAELFLQGLGALQRVGHVPGGHVPGKTVALENVFLEHLLRGAAVTGHCGLLQPGALIPDEVLEGLAGGKIRQGGVAASADLRFQGPRFVSDRLHGPAAAENLRVCRHGLVGGRVQTFQLLLLLFDPLLGRGHPALGNVCGQLVVLHHEFPEGVFRLAAVAIREELRHVGVALLLHKGLEALASLQLLKRSLKFLLVQRDLEGGFFPPYGIDAVAQRKDVGVHLTFSVFPHYGWIIEFLALHRLLTGFDALQRALRIQFDLYRHATFPHFLTRLTILARTGCPLTGPA